MKQGLNQAQIESRLEALDTRYSEYKLGNSLLEDKTWPTEKQLVIDWQMPADATRVMLFEKLQYMIGESFERVALDE